MNLVVPLRNYQFMVKIGEQNPICRRIFGASTVFGFGPQRLPFVSKTPKIYDGNRYSSNEEVITAVSGSHYKEGIHRLEDRWSWCINVQGDYTE